ncbi:hypothetical protein CANMA_004719 [Candida margitis]|uniref:uncharacterized protein n=1 Tax=Candida margitis TaxID=1775924 RepID=UPI002226AEAC|nr:uncharacterized protein CANMA_004719 [Candida margitis]KAI5953880.1 hypothetical protein CANMA_004719 [Candida margitis]
MTKEQVSNGDNRGMLVTNEECVNNQVLTLYKVHKDFSEILPDLFTVFQHTNNDIVSEETLPKDFYEPDPAAIIASLKAIDSKDFTSILHQYQAGTYNSSPYRLYHDIKAVASALLEKEDYGSEYYKEVDFFYKFSTELLLREVGTIIQSKSNPSNEIANELETQLDDDFNKILTTYTLANGEVVTYVSKTEEQDYQNHTNIYNPHHPPPIKQKIQPVFSSIISKSSLDTSPTLVAEPFTVTKVVPTIKDSNSHSLLENISPSSATIPPPLEGPTNILHDFFHPTWYTVAMPNWLTYKALSLRPSLELPQYADLPIASDEPPTLNLLRNHGIDKGNARSSWGSGHSYQSFAPNRDSKGAVVSDKLKANIWLNHIGLAEIEELKKNFINDGDAIDEDTEVEDVETTEPEAIKPLPNGQEEEFKLEDIDEENGDAKDENQDNKEQPEISLTNLIKWDPSEIRGLKFLKAHREDLLNPSKLQRLISSALLKLNQLRQERYFKSDVHNLLAPNDEEKQLYKCIQSLISIAIKLYNIGPNSFGFKVSNKIPTLVSEYNGTLPGMPSSRSLIGSGSQITADHLTRPGRLPNLRSSATRGRKRLHH